MIQKKLNILEEIGLTKENFSSASRSDVNNKSMDIMNFFVIENAEDENSKLAVNSLENKSISGTKTFVLFSS